MNETEIAFRKTDPWGLFRFAGINLTQKNSWDYGGKAMNNDLAIRWRSLGVKHRFEMDLKETYNWNTMDSRRLRGGPDVKYNGNFETKVALSTDRAKKMVFKVEYNGLHYIEEESQYNEVHPSLIFRLGNHVRLAGQFNFAWNRDQLQYVQTIVPAGGEEKTTYIMGRMKQETYGITLDMQVNVTPDVSLQFYGSPFTSIGKYDQFKQAEDTESSTYQNRFKEFTNSEISLKDADYHVESDGRTFTFKDPNFTFNEFRSNFVARWEYRPGSTVYLVWEHNRSKGQEVYHPGWGDNLDRIFGLAATNTFMMKINYWFNL